MGIFKDFFDKAVAATSRYAELIRFSGKIIAVESLSEIGWDPLGSTMDDVIGKRFGCFEDKDGNIYVFKTNAMFQIYLEKGDEEFLHYFVSKLRHELRHSHQHMMGKSILGNKWHHFHDAIYKKYGYYNCPLEVDARSFEHGKVTNMKETVSKWITENPDCL